MLWVWLSKEIKVNYIMIGKLGHNFVSKSLKTLWRDVADEQAHFLDQFFRHPLNKN